MASKNSTAAPTKRAARPTKTAAQKNAPAGLDPIRRTSSGHAGIAIAGDAAAAPHSGRKVAGAEVNGNSAPVTGSGKNVTERTTTAIDPADYLDISITEADDVTFGDRVENIRLKLDDVQEVLWGIIQSMSIYVGDGGHAEELPLLNLCLDSLERQSARLGNVQSWLQDGERAAGGVR